MNAWHMNRETPIATEDVRSVAALTAAIRVICITNQMRMQRQAITVARPPLHNVQIDLTGRVQVGFAFTEGHKAVFHVPSGHRLVIEHVKLSCWSKHEHVEIHLVTESRHMFRLMWLTSWPEQASLGDNAETGTAVPILVRGSTANTLLFSNGSARGSSTVPPDTYVQVWGYLEATHDGESF